jgi:hypothetical protein
VTTIGPDDDVEPDNVDAKDDVVRSNAGLSVLSGTSPKRDRGRRR